MKTKSAVFWKKLTTQFCPHSLLLIDDNFHFTALSLLHGKRQVSLFPLLKGEAS